ncbi:low molecular weight protein-tyrosine-phosphatase [uncultured Aliivibrio sp.]|uniref:low molecular weight protein-tyrosine-phosphatase n=1 Tax=uncultured Aliivibrio sp. TaxID=873085 RepID=UPI00260AF28B|nr:low molecular weight protein-tyrosine-phosphatase [uncultured Aliivibrio sp.]
MFNRILVVCTGNICRSPIAEVLLKAKLPNNTVESAGISVTKSNLNNAGAHPYSQQVCNENGVDISRHRARQLTPELCYDFDLILVMSHEQIEEVAQLAPLSRSKTMLLGYWIGQGEVIDPIHKPKEAFDLLFNTLNRASHAWSQKLETRN